MMLPSCPGTILILAGEKLYPIALGKHLIGFVEGDRDQAGPPFSGLTALRKRSDDLQTRDTVADPRRQGPVAAGKLSRHHRPSHQCR